MALIEIIMVLSILIRASHQRTASEWMTQVVLPKCPLFNSESPLYVVNVFTYARHELTHSYLAARTGVV